MEIAEMKKEAADMIVGAANFASIAGLNASDCGIGLSASLYLNIRDAMFHFKALCDYADDNDKENVMRHYFNLKEHLLRGEKDAVISQGQAVCDAVDHAIQQNCFDTTLRMEDLKELQNLTHKLKDIILNLRMDGSRLSNETMLYVSNAWHDVTEYTRQMVQICRKRNITFF
jgi:PAS domain-containing protein